MWAQISDTFDMILVFFNTKKSNRESAEISFTLIS